MMCCTPERENMKSDIIFFKVPHKYANFKLQKVYIPDKRQWKGHQRGEVRPYLYSEERQ
jgi:hypothetical protein